MSIEFNIDTEAGVVYTVGRGPISFEEFKEHRDKMLSHPDYNKEFVLLVDYREVVVDRSTDQALQVAKSRPFAKIGVVAGEQSYGIARMVQGWSGEEAYRVFRDMASAREWLGLPREEC